MGVYIRQDSPFYWLLLERPGQKPLYEPTKIPHAARSAEVRKQQRQLAQDVYISRMNDLARRAHRLPATRTVPFSAQVDWYEVNVLPTLRGADRERAALIHLRAFFGDDDLITLTPDRVHEYETHRLRQFVPRTKRHVSARTVNREVGVLKQVLQSAVPRYFDVSPIRGVELLRVVKPKKRILEADEEARLLAAMRPVDRAFYLVALDTLMRLSNVINLRRDEDKGTHFELTDSKTGPYEVVISTRVRAALDALPEDGDYYFPHRRQAKNERDWRGAVRLMLKRACAKAGVPYGRAVGGITFHTGTRATGATRILRAGHDLKTLMEVGNWRDMRSAGEYLHSNRQLQRNAVNAITPALRPPSKPPKRAGKSR